MAGRAHARATESVRYLQVSAFSVRLRVGYSPSTVRLRLRDRSASLRGFVATLRHSRLVTVTVPAYSELLWPTLQAAIALGGPASIAELDAAVIEREKLTPEQQSVLLSGGPQTVVQRASFLDAGNGV